MKKTKIITHIVIVALLLLTMIGYLAFKHFYGIYLSEKTINTAYKIVSEQSVNVEKTFGTNKKMFDDAVNEIMKLPSQFKGVTMDKEKIYFDMKSESKQDGKEQYINSVSQELQATITELSKVCEDIWISTGSYDDISFTLVDDTYDACFFEISLVYSKNGMRENEDVKKLNNNWYLVKSVNWGT